jgi:hypothetical protein
MQNDFMLSFIMPTVIILVAIKLDVIILSVVAPLLPFKI